MSLVFRGSSFLCVLDRYSCRFYRDVLGFEIQEGEDAVNVYLIKDGTLFMLYERKNFEEMTNRRYEYLKGLNGHFEIALYVDTFEEVDEE